MLKVKDGVEFKVIAPGGFRIIMALKAISRNLEVPLTITSGTDSVHGDFPGGLGENDPHYRGEAYDVRTHDLVDNKNQLIYMLNTMLGREFYAFLENPGTASEHCHVQVTNGAKFTMQDLLDLP